MERNTVFGKSSWVSAVVVPMSEVEKKKIEVHYGVFNTQFGRSLIAVTSKGVCFIAFGDEPFMLSELLGIFPNARKSDEVNIWQRMACEIISGNIKADPLPLHIYGTPFHLEVWKALLHIPHQKLSTYKAIAQRLGNPEASRAVGSAVGNNPVSYIIPCHRVIRTDGQLGGYRWGLDVKKIMIGSEAE